MVQPVLQEKTDPLDLPAKTDLLAQLDLTGKLVTLVPLELLAILGLKVLLVLQE